MEDIIKVPEPENEEERMGPMYFREVVGEVKTPVEGEFCVNFPSKASRFDQVIVPSRSSPVEGSTKPSNVEEEGEGGGRVGFEWIGGKQGFILYFRKLRDGDSSRSSPSEGAKSAMESMIVRVLLQSWEERPVISFMNVLRF